MTASLVPSLNDVAFSLSSQSMLITRSPISGWENWPSNPVCWDFEHSHLGPNSQSRDDLISTSKEILSEDCADDPRFSFLTGGNMDYFEPYVSQLSITI